MAEKCDFKIGCVFIIDENDSRQYMCTDIGTRVIIGVRCDSFDISNGTEVKNVKYAEDPTWLNGPPYGLAEIVFDEYDFEVMDIIKDQHEHMLRRIKK